MNCGGIDPQLIDSRDESVRSLTSTALLGAKPCLKHMSELITIGVKSRQHGGAAGVGTTTVRNAGTRGSTCMLDSKVRVVPPQMVTSPV